MSLLRGNHGVFRSGKTAGSFLLDQVSITASAAYSVRKLRSGYSGNCIRVRRSSDNAEMNIGFSGNDLDTATLLSFVGGGNGFVTTWYDQSGNSKNGTQSTGASQPKIVNSGVISSINLRYALEFSNSQFFDATYPAFSGTITGNNVSRFALITQGSVDNDYIYSIGDTNSLGNTFNFARWSIGDVYYLFDGANARSGPLLTGQVGKVFTQTYKQSSPKHNLWMNGVAQTVVEFSGAMNANGTARIGGLVGYSHYFEGQISELIFFPTSLSNTDRQVLERNQGVYYNISVA